MAMPTRTTPPQKEAAPYAPDYAIVGLIEIKSGDMGTAQERCSGGVTIVFEPEKVVLLTTAKASDKGLRDMRIGPEVVEHALVDIGTWVKDNLLQVGIARARLAVHMAATQARQTDSNRAPSRRHPRERAPPANAAGDAGDGEMQVPVRRRERQKQRRPPRACGYTYS